MEIDENTARILSCDLSIRPRSAAGILDVMPHVREVRRELDAVVISLDVSGEEPLNSFVEAERLCCASLTWLLQRDEKLIQLRIAGNEDQLASIESWFDVK